MIYETPTNVVQLLDDVVGAAVQTPFYRSVLQGHPRVTCMEDFKRLPVTPISSFRKQRLADVITDPSIVQWIAGPYKGQNRTEVAVAEGADESGNRHELFRDALRQAFPDRPLRTCAVITSPEKRYFAAEISAILGYLGIPAHLFIDHGTMRSYEVLHHVKPDLLVILTDNIQESRLPSSLELCLTFRHSHKLANFRQLDLHVVDELGFLGHSTDLVRWILYNDQYLYEQSQDRRLIVTALHNHAQPLLRLETQDTVRALGKHEVELETLSSSG